MSWRKFIPLACALLAPFALFAGSVTPTPAATATPIPKDSKKTPAGKKDAESAAKASNDDEQQNSVLAGIPSGQVYHGMHIPNFSPTGKLLMLFDATTAKRIADREIELQGLKIEIHNDDGSTFHVEMAHAMFDLDTRTLTSDTPTTIQRDDFTINGDRAQFHVKERFGRVMGNVKMIINSGNMSGADSNQKPTKLPKPDTKTNSGHKTK